MALFYEYIIDNINMLLLLIYIYIIGNMYRKANCKCTMSQLLSFLLSSSLFFSFLLFICLYLSFLLFMCLYLSFLLFVCLYFVFILSLLFSYVSGTNMGVRDWWHLRAFQHRCLRREERMWFIRQHQNCTGTLYKSISFLNNLYP